MRRVLPFLLVALTAGCRTPSAAGAPSAACLSEAQLRQVEERARHIVTSERGAIRASDLLMARADLDASRVRMFFTVSRGNAWYAVFGKLEAPGPFVPAYAYRAPLEFSDQMEAFPVESLPEGLDAVARAVSTATERTFQAHGRRQLNPVVFEEDGGLTVYVLQGFGNVDFYLLGGDFRFRFSADGRTLRQEEPLHPGIIPVAAQRTGPDAPAHVSMHTHELHPGPLETELAQVMLYPEFGGQVVSTEGHVCAYVFTPEGTVHTVDLKRDAPPRMPPPDAAPPPAETL